MERPEYDVPTISGYKVKPQLLQEWLRAVFDDESITVIVEDNDSGKVKAVGLPRPLNKKEIRAMRDLAKIVS